MNCYQILTPDPEIWDQIKSELATCNKTPTQFQYHSNYEISDSIKHLVAAQLALWDIPADIVGVSGWISGGAGWSMDWHRDGTDSISHVLCLYSTPAPMTRLSGGRLAIKDQKEEWWFDITDGLCVLMDQTDPNYLHKVERIYSISQRKCISVSLKCHTT